MKNALKYIALAICWFATPDMANAQTFTTAYPDTIFINANSIITPGTFVYHNDITNHSAQAIDITWHVTYDDFPADWKTGPGLLGICDASICYNNPPLGAKHTTFNQPYISDSAKLFDLQLTNYNALTTFGTHAITVNLKDTTNASGYNKNITFVVSRLAADISKTSKTVSDITLYPNPARNELNVLFNPDADIRIISVYNLIGKAVTVYKLTSNSSAKLDIENLPSGVYFIRIIDGAGQVVATRKFTHQ